MSRFTRNLAFAISFLLLLPAVALVAATPAGPSISTPSISPSSPGPSDQVTVTATVTAGSSGVLNVTLVYSTDNWTHTNTTVLAVYNATSQQATAHIPAQYNGGHVEYYLVAFDGNGNKKVNNNNGSYFSYTVTTQPSTTTNTWIELALVAAALGAGGIFAFYSLRPKTRTGTSSTSPN
jgi:predicted secreted protein